MKEASQPPQVLPISANHAPVAKSPVTVAEQPVRYPYALLELRRSLTITAVIIVLLIVLYFLLR